MNDTELKQLLAKMLPETVECRDGMLFWLRKGGLLNIHDTELLHLCSLVDDSLTESQLAECFEILGGTLNAVYHATWQQRTEALAKVKVLI